MKRFVASATLALSCSLLLTGCDNPFAKNEPEPEPTTEQQPAPETKAEEAKTFDTGPYRTEPADYSNMIEPDDESGPFIEQVLIADNVLLPYEIDRKFNTGVQVQRAWKSNALVLSNFDFLHKHIEQYNDKMVGGHLVSASEGEDSPLGATHLILRYRDEETAKKVAEQVFQVHEDFAEDLNIRKSPTELAGRPDTLAVIEESNYSTALETATTHNEFVIFTHTEDENKDAAKRSTEWMPEYTKTYLEKQIPLLDTIPTRKSEEGFGKNDKWQPLDRTGLLKYTVNHTDQDGDPGWELPGAVNKRQMASYYVATDKVLNIMELAGVTDDDLARNTTSIWRAGSESGAEMIVSAFKSLDAAEDWRPYDEPQNVPGTQCATFEKASRFTYVCYMQYENFFATASESESTLGEKEEGEDPKKKLSQRMAAQYEIFQKMDEKDKKGS